MVNLTTPQDTSRLVDLDVLLGKRGIEGDRAVRLRELPSFVDQAVAFILRKPSTTKHLTAILDTDLSIPTTPAWSAGPELELKKGTWQITATLNLKTSVAGFVIARVSNGGAALMGSQQSHPGTVDHYTTISLSGVVVLAADATLRLEATSPIGDPAVFIIARTTADTNIDATRLMAVQIGD